MTSIFIVIVAFFIMYIIVYIRQIRKTKENNVNAVEEFRSDYKKYQDDAIRKYKNPKSNNSTNYTYKYITKYNNPEDYREK